MAEIDVILVTTQKIVGIFGKRSSINSQINEIYH